MTDHHHRYAEPGVDDASRRAFLAASGVALTGAALGAPNARLASAAPVAHTDSISTPLLELSDLLAPPGESYLPWRVEPPTAPLLSHLAETTPLDVSDALLGGFVGRVAEQAPQFVETAAIPVADAGDAAEQAVDEWVAAIHGAGVERTSAAGDVEWRATADGWTDVVRLRHVGDWLLVASVGGRTAARVPPAAAAARYLTLLAERAGEPAQ